MKYEKPGMVVMFSAIGASTRHLNRADTKMLRRGFAD
jgi:hypothetical protein